MPSFAKNGKIANGPSRITSRPTGGTLIPRALDRTGDAGLSLAALLGLCDPVVDANLLPVEGARRLRYLGRHASLAEVSVAHRAHTFWITGDPSSPLGRMRNMMMRSANT